MVIKQIIAVFTKELKSEFRTRYAISSVLLFIVTTVTMIVFATAGESINSTMASGLLWIIMFFGAMTGLSKTFVSEEERGTGFLLQISTSSTSIFFGKLFFNILLSLALNILNVFLMLLFLGNIKVYHVLDFSLLIVLASLGLASSTTLISALIAKANTKNALFPVLSFPILLPLIILGIQATIGTLEIEKIKIFNDYLLIISYCGVMILSSYFLFDYVWKE